MALVPSKTEFVVTPRNGVMDTLVEAEPPPSDTTLSNAANDLAVGETVHFPCPGLEPWTGPVTHPLYGIQWVNRWHYDNTARRAVMFGKNAMSSGYSRFISVYDENAHTWAYGAFNPENELGHVYESFAFDPDEWSAYTGYWNDSSILQRWTYGEPLTALTAPVADNIATISDAAGATGQQGMVCWHPNLFGAADGGILASSPTNGRLRAWQKSSGAPGRWEQVPNTLATITGPVPGRGSACYVRAWDEVIYSLDVNYGGKTWRVPAGSGGSLGSAVEISAPPMPCGYVGSDNRALLVDDPAGLGGPYLLEKGGVNRAWRLSATYTWDAIDDHPIPVLPLNNFCNWCITPLYPYGVFWIMGAATTASGAHSQLWRPGDQA